MHAILHTIKLPESATSRRHLKGVAYAAAASLSAVSGLAFAEGEELQTLVMPDRYTIDADGRASLQLMSGEALILQNHQFLLLEGGLLMVVDEMAHTAMMTLPVMGALRTQLLTEIAPVRSSVGSEITMSDARPLWTGDRAPRLFEEVQFERYELAQNGNGGPLENADLGTTAAGAGLGIGLISLARFGTGGPTGAPVANVVNNIITIQRDTGDGNGGAGNKKISEFIEFSDPDDDIVSITMNSGAAALSLSPGTPEGIVSGSWDAVLNSGTTAWTALVTAASATVTDSKGNTDTADLLVAGQLVLPDGLVADSADVTIIGKGADDYVGYWDSDGAATSPLSGLARGPGVTVDIDLGSGQNHLRLGHLVALSGGSMTYTGGQDLDQIRVADNFANGNGVVTIDNSKGGTNVFTSGDSPAVSGTMNYIGGNDSDSLTMGRWFGNYGGSVDIDMSRGGNNSLTAMWMAGASGNKLEYTGGEGTDELTFGMHLGSFGGNVEIDMTKGGDNSLEATDNAAVSAQLSYKDGDGIDKLSFGNWLASGEGEATFDLSGGGSNHLEALDYAGISGTLAITGGVNQDKLSFGNWFANFHDAARAGEAHVIFSGSTDKTVIKGINSHDNAGVVVSGGGDIDGDGEGEVMVAATGVNFTRGAVYLLDGAFLETAPAEIDLAALTSSMGTVINGRTPTSRAGIAMSSIGDVDNDGVDDIGIMTLGDSYSDGSFESYVLYGSYLATDPGTIELGSLTPSMGLVLTSALTGGYEADISNVGDVDGDTIDDIAMSYGSLTPTTYILKGSAIETAKGAAETSIDLDSAGGDVAAITFPGSYSVNQIASLGDQNADGKIELALASGWSADLYVLDGSAISGAMGSTVSVSSLVNSNGYKFNGISGSIRSISHVPDISGDGKDELLIGQPDWSWGVTSTLAQIVMSSALTAGNQYSAGGTVDLTTLGLSDRVPFIGATTAQTWWYNAASTGAAVGAAGDIDGDGVEDILIAGPGWGGSMGGGVNVVSGAAITAATQPISLTASTGSVLFNVDDSNVDSGDLFGSSLGTVIDLDGDGEVELVIGAPGADRGSHSVSIDNSAGGINTLETGWQPAKSGRLSYVGGDSLDVLTFGGGLGSNGGEVTIDLSAGGHDILTTEDFSVDNGSLNYLGSPDKNEIEVGHYFSNHYGTSIFDLRAGGSNEFKAGDWTAQSGELTIYGGFEDEALTFGPFLAAHGGYATFDMASGGENTLDAGDYSAQSGDLIYTGGADADVISLGSYVASNSGQLMIDMTAGGDNSLQAGDHVAHDGDLSYTGGADRDTLAFGDSLGEWGNTVQFDMTMGGDNELVAGDNAARTTTNFTYLGGPGKDTLTFGDGFSHSGDATLDFGADSAADRVTFEGSVSLWLGDCEIVNYDPLLDIIDVPHQDFNVTYDIVANTAQVTSTASTEFSFTIIGASTAGILNGIV